MWCGEVEVWPEVENWEKKAAMMRVVSGSVE
jgi:hypothetical protein